MKSDHTANLPASFFLCSNHRWKWWNKTSCWLIATQLMVDSVLTQLTEIGRKVLGMKVGPQTRQALRIPRLSACERRQPRTQLYRGSRDQQCCQGRWLSPKPLDSTEMNFASKSVIRQTMEKNDLKIFAKHLSWCSISQLKWPKGKHNNKPWGHLWHLWRPVTGEKCLFSRQALDTDQGRKRAVRTPIRFSRVRVVIWQAWFKHGNLALNTSQIPEKNWFSTKFTWKVN